MKHILQFFAFIVLLLTNELAGKTLIFPPAALPDLEKLGPARIETRWKPRSLPDGYFPTVEGYYVVYNHENLALFFGPVDTEPEAVKIQGELEETRKYLISKNPGLNSSTVGRIKIDFGGQPPSHQDPPSSGGLKPVRVMSGNSTLELGKENEASDSTSGAATEETQSSDYGLGSSSQGSAQETQESTETTTSSSAETGRSADSPTTGSGATGSEEDKPTGSPLGPGILNVLQQGIPPESQGAPPGTENPEDATGGSGSRGQETGDETGSPGSTGMEAGTPSGQSPPTLPEGAIPPSLSQGLPETASEESGLETSKPGQESATPTAQIEGQASNSGQSGDASLEEAEEQLNATDAPSGDATSTDSSNSTETAESSETNASETSAKSSNQTADDTSDPVERSSTAKSSESPGTQSSKEELATIEEKTEETNEPETDEDSTETEDPTPPTPVSLELGETKKPADSNAATIHINQLLKRKLGESVPLVPPDEQE